MFQWFRKIAIEQNVAKQHYCSSWMSVDGVLTNKCIKKMFDTKKMRPAPPPPPPPPPPWPLKFGNRWVISFYTLLGMWLFIYAGIKVNLRYK